MKSVRKTVVKLAVATSVFVLPLIGSAQTITFDNLPGSNGDLFTGPYVESGFNVSLTGGGICVAKVFGNPTPDLFGSNGCHVARQAQLTITKVGGGLFRFLGTDLATGDGGSVLYQFIGNLGATNPYQQSASFSSGSFAQVASANPTTDIDELRINLILEGNTNSFNIDNIALASATVVPEPSSFALIGLGLAAVGTLRRRKARSAK